MSTTLTRVKKTSLETDSSFAHDNQVNDQQCKSNTENFEQVPEQMNSEEAQKNGNIRDKVNAEI